MASRKILAKFSQRRIFDTAKHTGSFKQRRKEKKNPLLQLISQARYHRRTTHQTDNDEVVIMCYITHQRCRECNTRRTILPTGAHGRFQCVQYHRTLGMRQIHRVHHRNSIVRRCTNCQETERVRRWEAGRHFVAQQERAGYVLRYLHGRRIDPRSTSDIMNAHNDYGFLMTGQFPDPVTLELDLEFYQWNDIAAGQGGRLPEFRRYLCGQRLLPLDVRHRDSYFYPGYMQVMTQLVAENMRCPNERCRPESHVRWGQHMLSMVRTAWTRQVQLDEQSRLPDHGDRAFWLINILETIDPDRFDRQMQRQIGVRRDWENPDPGNVVALQELVLSRNCPHQVAAHHHREDWARGRTHPVFLSSFNSGQDPWAPFDEQVWRAGREASDAAYRQELANLARPAEVESRPRREVTPGQPRLIHPSTSAKTKPAESAPGMRSRAVHTIVANAAAEARERQLRSEDRVALLEACDRTFTDEE